MAANSTSAPNIKATFCISTARDSLQPRARRGVSCLCGRDDSGGAIFAFSVDCIFAGFSSVMPGSCSDRGVPRKRRCSGVSRIFRCRSASGGDGTPAEGSSGDAVSSIGSSSAISPSGWRITETRQVFLSNAIICPTACTVVRNFCLDHPRAHLLGLRRHFLLEGKRNGATRADGLEFSMPPNPKLFAGARRPQRALLPI